MCFVKMVAGSSREVIRIVGEGTTGGPNFLGQWAARFKRKRLPGRRFQGKMVGNEHKKEGTWTVCGQ